MIDQVFLFIEQKLFTSYLHILAPLWGKMEDIQYLYNDGIPFGQEELRTHRPHILAKGLSLQMSWVIFHYPGSEESSV